MMFLDDLINTANKSIERYPEALSYLDSRGVTLDEIKKYRIGYSKILNVPDDGSADRKKFMDDSWKGKKFENVILLPFIDALGRVVGLIGRSPSKKQFKIFATEEAKFTGFFFGLYQALPEIYKTGRVYIVEGPFDVLAFSKVCPNVVGALTAGLNDAQFEFLRFYCREIFTVFDSDPAGERAKEEAMEWVSLDSGSDFNFNFHDTDSDSKAPDHGLRKLKIQRLDIGYKDPDECLKKMGLLKFKKHIEKQIKGCLLLS